jgi:alkylglycerol monooxygenase
MAIGAFMNAPLYTMVMIFVLFILERIVSTYKKKENFNIKEFISNCACGIGMSLFDLIFIPIYAILYQFIYKFAPIKVTPNFISGFILFIFIDLLWYLYHRSAHKFSFLWSFHVVHHQPTFFNISVGLRDSWFARIATSTIYFVPAFLGFPLKFYAFVLAWQVGYNFWTHTTLIKKMPLWFEWLFISPELHAVHHGQNPKYIDKNFGEVLSVWDRLFGTFQKEEEKIIFGVTNPTPYLNPFRASTESWIKFKGSSLFKYRGVLEKQRTSFGLLCIGLSVVGFISTLYFQQQNLLGMSVLFGVLALALSTLGGDLVQE